jgi:hypothetical protein
VNQSYTHDLSRLVQAAGLDGALNARIRASAGFSVNWNVVKDWSEESRYDHTTTKLRRMTCTGHYPTIDGCDAMGTTPLVETDVHAGRAVIDAIKGAIPIREAFWEHFTGPEEWRLVIVTPLAESAGPLAAYSAVQRAIPANTLPLRRVSVVGPGDSLVRFLGVTPRCEGAVTVVSSSSSTASGGVDSVYLYPKPAR